MKDTILKIIYWVLLLFVVVVAVVPVLSSIEGPVPFRFYAVQTGSMEPAIKVGDLILVKEEEEYKQGDVITFRGGTGDSQKTITHRIEKVNEDGTFITKGDANSAADIDLVKEEDIIGRYFFRIPLLGYPINFARTPVGFLGLIAVPAVIIGYEEAKKIKDEIKTKKYQK